MRGGGCGHGGGGVARDVRGGGRGGQKFQKIFFYFKISKNRPKYKKKIFKKYFLVKGCGQGRRDEGGGTKKNQKYFFTSKF